MAGQQMALGLAVDFFFHFGLQLAHARQFKEHILGIAKIKKIVLPSPLVIARVLKPRAAQAFDDDGAAIGSFVRGYLPPKTNHGAAFFVDDEVVVGVTPGFKTFHLIAHGHIEDFFFYHGR